MSDYVDVQGHQVPIYKGKALNDGYVPLDGSFGLGVKRHYTKDPASCATDELCDASLNQYGQVEAGYLIEKGKTGIAWLIKR